KKATTAVADEVIRWFKRARYSKTKDELEEKWESFVNGRSLPDSVVKYMGKVLREWKETSALWVLNEIQGCEGDRGATSNPAESFNKVIKDIEHKQVAVDHLAAVLRWYMQYSVNELERWKHSAGDRKFKNSFQHLADDPLEKYTTIPCPEPEKILEFIMNKQFLLDGEDFNEEEEKVERADPLIADAKSLVSSNAVRSSPGGIYTVACGKSTFVVRMKQNEKTKEVTLTCDCRIN
ncbi:hypothetical protein PFISCL1PPCAC_26008, partial [Pristionchus fissidentatus]